MPKPDVDVLSETIGLIYAAAHRPDAWAGVVEGVRDLFGGSKACISRLGPALGPQDSVSTASDPRFTRMIVEEFCAEGEPLSPAVSTMPIGVVYHDHALVGRERLRTSRFWNEWMAPQDMYGGLGCRLAVSGPSSWFVDVQRGRRQQSFSNEDAAMFSRLVPHFVQSLALSRRYREAQASLAALDRVPFGVVLVDARLRIVSENAAARALLDRRDGALARRASGHLGVTRTGETESLRRLVARACQTDATEIAAGRMIAGSALSPGRGDLALSVAPLGADPDEWLPGEPLAVISMCETGPRPVAGLAEEARRAFRLSPKEAAVAVGLVSGLTLREAAEREGIAFSTARSYLETIFAKTGTRRQSQLVGLLERIDTIRLPD